MKIKVKENEAGLRLDKYISDKLPDINRSQVKKKIEQGSVKVNKNSSKASYSVKEGDVLEFSISKEGAVVEKKKQIKEDKKINKAILKKIKIIASTDDYLVINKPAGLVVHGEEYINEYSLADWLLDKYPELEGVGENEHRPGIVHRLDKEASGLMVVARNQKAYNNLKKQFQKRTVEKKYKALVFGRVIKDSDKINFPIKRSNAGNKQAAVPVESEEKDIREAITIFEVEKKFINYTLLDVLIKTGRKHQIRVHMYAYGHPIVGDPLYNTKKTREANKKLDLGRIFLLSYHLSFKDLSGDVCNFEVSFPKELKDFLKIIK